eukprot:COSAG05_NODE_2884_length_2540_cov_3.141745_1_plen_347_part_00
MLYLYLLKSMRHVTLLNTFVVRSIDMPCSCSMQYQKLIYNMLEECRNASFTEEIDGFTITRSFTGQAALALRMIGPADCSYHYGAWLRLGLPLCHTISPGQRVAGYQRKCASNCTTYNMSQSLGTQGVTPGNGCIRSFMGVTLSQWYGCDSDMQGRGCWQKFVSLVRHCSGCTNDFTTKFLDDGARMNTAKECQSLDSDSNCKTDYDSLKQMATKIETMCCNGWSGEEDGPDPCTDVRDDEYDFTWRVPLICFTSPAPSLCQAYVQSLAMSACPAVFFKRNTPRNIFANCGGDLQSLNCSATMDPLCRSARASSVGNCLVCVGMHQSQLMRASCTEADMDEYCNKP